MIIVTTVTITVVQTGNSMGLNWINSLWLPALSVLSVFSYVFTQKNGKFLLKVPKLGGQLKWSIVNVMRPIFAGLLLLLVELDQVCI